MFIAENEINSLDDFKLKGSIENAAFIENYRSLLTRVFPYDFAIQT